EAAMLGEALSMLVPQVVGFRLTGALREGATATDLVLTVTQILRATGVVGKFVEYFGPGVPSLALADRATLGNMSPEYGATCGFFPVDEVTLEYMRLTGRPDWRIALVEAYCKENMLWHEPDAHPEYSQVVELDLDDVEPSLAGPRRGLRARARLGRDRRHHLVHEHVEPVGDDRRGTGREEGGRARIDAYALGEVVARAGLEGRNGVLRTCRARHVSRRARLQHRR